MTVVLPETLADPKVQLGDLLYRVSWSEDVEEVWVLLTEYMAAHGFDRILYAATRFRGPRSSAKRQTRLS